jgi:hypothetical protein
MPDAEEWKILTVEAAHEKDPEKLLEIVESLTAAIDKELSEKAEPSQKPAPSPVAPAA